MCGFAGYLRFNYQSVHDSEELQSVVLRMAKAIAHRGPDDAGAWVDTQAGIALGHRRLSIVDLSPAGHQPMQLDEGRYVLAYNGEIYNHRALRGELEKISFREWRGHSDTETLLAGFETWGVEATLKKAVGMFAITLWDQQNKMLTLARDRFGEKPLYYGWVGQGAAAAFVFGSELKALRAYPGFDADISREALAQYLRFMYVPAPRSIYKGIFKLEPGCMLTLSGSASMHAPTDVLRPGDTHGTLRVHRWWALGDAVAAGAQNQVTDEVQAVQLLEAQLSETVRLQSLADVPLGAFLSGGVDSSAIVALMQKQSSRAVKTFTIGFDEAGFDEAPYARAVAQHLGTEHHEMRVSAVMAQDVIRSLPEMYDEPFADSSQIPTHLVCKAAREHVSVALSGDAGDELFGGYNRYFWGPRIWNRLAWMPYPLRKTLGAIVSSVPVSKWDAFGGPINALMGKHGVSRLGDKLHKLGLRLQTVRGMDDLYRSLVSEWQDPSLLLQSVGGQYIVEPANTLDDIKPGAGLEQDPLPMMYSDTMTYLPDDILCKVDRAAMATSLETRVPFLDHRVVELAWHLPLHMKVRGSTGKWALRQLLYKHVPKNLIERPKAGFAIPIGQWLRGPLREWAEDLLDERRIKDEGYLKAEPIRQKWKEHLDGNGDHTSSLWAVLMFQAWLERSNK
jgi:asparagine synthase (glutamine-hydrolysing)